MQTMEIESPKSCSVGAERTKKLRTAYRMSGQKKVVLIGVLVSVLCFVAVLFIMATHQDEGPVRPNGQETWFRKLFGFEDTSDKIVHKLLECRENTMANHKKGGPTYRLGSFSRPTIAELRELASQNLSGIEGKIKFRHYSGDVVKEHIDPLNRFATFQVSSQYNCLQARSTDQSSDMRLSMMYRVQNTQGSSCAVSCAPALVYRYYFAFEGHKGQTPTRQFNNLEAFSAMVGNNHSEYFWVSDGFVRSTAGKLEELNRKLSQCSYDDLVGAFKVGIQSDTQVTALDTDGRRPPRQQCVSQVYVSAAGVGDALNPDTTLSQWEIFGRMALDAAYEGTILAALASAVRKQGRFASTRVYLTTVGFGGGAQLGSKAEWTVDSIRKVLYKYKHIGLDIVCLHMGTFDPGLDQLSREFPGDDVPAEPPPQN